METFPKDPFKMAEAWIIHRGKKNTLGVTGGFG